jgi:hypothetical protein
MRSECKQSIKFHANGFSRWTLILLVQVALFSSLLHIAPYWRAQSQTPPNWSFTADISGSPDSMQYRVWTRKSQETGFLVDNTFTSEPNKPHLPVVYYYIIGQISAWTGLTPEWVMAYAGSVFAFGFTILLFVLIYYFMKSTYQTWWVFGILLLGGGLGAYLKILSRIEALRDNFILGSTLIKGAESWPLWEDYRHAYIVIILFDAHYLLFWLLTTGSIFALYFTLRKFTPWRLGLTALLYIVTTVLHLYEGITLIAITASSVLLCWSKKQVGRSAFFTLGICSLMIAIVIAWQVFLYHHSGLPLPTWRSLNVLLSTFLIAYPLAWGLIGWGISRYWHTAGFDESFLLGWILGCTLITFSGPFYPYPGRGLMTLQIPLYIVAGMIYFSRFSRVNLVGALVTVALLGATPLLVLKYKWDQSSFGQDRTYAFINRDHQEMIHLLHSQAAKNDLLIVDKTKPPWRTDDLWLFPDYPGKLYCGHFFLTPNYEQKCEQINRFFHNSTLKEQEAFLQDHKIRFVYVDVNNNPRQFEHIPGLKLLRSTTVGALFEYTGFQD